VRDAVDDITGRLTIAWLGVGGGRPFLLTGYIG
jgi:hypothetical protein